MGGRRRVYTEVVACRPGARLGGLGTVASLCEQHGTVAEVLVPLLWTMFHPKDRLELEFDSEPWCQDFPQVVPYTLCFKDYMKWCDAVVAALAEAEA